jgi:hypothetical protein
MHKIGYIALAGIPVLGAVAGSVQAARKRRKNNEMYAEGTEFSGAIQERLNPPEREMAQES